MTNSNNIAGFLVVLKPAELAAKLPFYFGSNIIGKSAAQATIIINDPSISRQHA